MKRGLVIDLDTCVGCHACAVACKEWNGASALGGPSPDYQPFGAEPSGVWFNRVRHYEAGDYPDSKTVNMPMSCLHCEDAACVTVCPTGASYKREDGIVLVDPDKCMGCNYCAWACPYGARELDEGRRIERVGCGSGREAVLDMAHDRSREIAALFFDDFKAKPNTLITDVNTWACD